MSRDVSVDTTKVPLAKRLSHGITSLSKLKGLDDSTNKIFPTSGSMVVPFAPQTLSHSSKSLGRGSIGFEPQRKISAISSTRMSQAQIEPNMMTVWALAKLNKSLKNSPRTKRSLQRLDVDRHQKVLEQYTIRVHTKEPDEAEVTQPFPFLIVSPAAKWYKLWQLFSLALIIYQSFQIPYVLGFGSSASDPFHDVEGIIFNSIFGIDFLLNCVTALPDPSKPGKYITNRCTIVWRYMQGWFFPDLIACFPFDMVISAAIYGSGGLSGGTSLTFLSLLKTVRLPRLLRLARLVRVLKILQIPPEWKRWLLYSRYAHLIRLISTIAIFFFTIHICACVWNGGIASQGWQDMFPNIQKGDVSDYVLSYFFCLETFLGQTQDLHNQTEFVFAICLIFVGALLMAAVFGDVAVLLSNFHEKQNDYKKKMEWLFSCMGTMRLPLDLQNRIHEFYQTMWDVHETLDGQPATLTNELSRNLAVEVELFLRMDMINRVPIFHTCSKRVVQEIVMQLSVDVFLPGDYIVVRGEVAFEMYFVQTGVCEVTSGRETSSFGLGPSHETLGEESVLRLLKQGDFFGEIALLMQCKRTASVRAKTFAELCVLTREVFESITARYLEDRERMEKHITEKYDPVVLRQIAEQKQRAAPPPPPHDDDQSTPVAPSSPSATSLSDRRLLMDAIVKLTDRVDQLERKQDKFLAEIKLLVSRPGETSPRLSIIHHAAPHHIPERPSSSDDDDDNSFSKLLPH
ncbi:hypothetical protein LEN26_004766 [Aphanomyces euteiches]|nr:hypothetical protein AeMF1_002512 [Aphanomyces euteiches]KAH9147258.1 hypothetical protein LEN26_004766 [Aphanomyces euteiches]KAH9192531.1 hypothetical protein AeNC1_005487 [Aphanomyces euteiches]